ncbi:MAG: hypothetical protein R3318_06125, partial [Gammaproteobacteria bacterium]|nr:hypothetical protein [Gammaproteobacteria bacterium]
PATPSMAESVEIYTEDHISVLEDEISELRQSRRALEVEKATLEQDLKTIRHRRDALKQKITALESKEADVEISGNRSQVAWLNHIYRLWNQDQISLVEQNLVDFRKQHPDYPRQQLVKLFSEDLIRRSDPR